MNLKAMAYDFIIVGGGSAGCVLAHRLVKSEQATVLLIESGPKDSHPYIHMPAGFAKLTGTSHSWGYSTAPQKDLGGRAVWYPQGRVLGGGSSINAQVYTRGNAKDYDRWSENGAEGWSYNEILQYFRKAEDNQRFDNEFHGQGGPLKVSDPTPHDMTTVYVRAAQQAGLAYNPDFNGAEQMGSGYYQLTNRHAKRCSAAQGYLAPVADHANLDVLTGTHVAKITTSGDRATGVELIIGSGRTTIEAKREVLVTSGAIGSPRLLMHSGIGPAAHLKSVNIPSVRDIAGVGQNLQDHLDVYCVSECSGDYSFDKYKSPVMTAMAGLQYLMFKTGPVSSNLCDGGGFWYADENAASPDVQFHFLPGSGLEHGLKKIRNGVTLNSALLRPKSRGSVRLKSNNPTEAPSIDPNYWGDAYDIEMSIKAFKLTRHIMSQKAWAPYIKAESMPGADAKTDDDIRDYAFKFAKTDYHPVGTCKMGAKEDKMAVVGTDLLVRDFENLRVCDSASMPDLPSSNTNAPTIMIAEKAADMILAHHKLA